MKFWSGMESCSHNGDRVTTVQKDAPSNLYYKPGQSRSVIKIWHQRHLHDNYMTYCLVPSTCNCAVAKYIQVYTYDTITIPQTVHLHAYICIHFWVHTCYMCAVSSITLYSSECMFSGRVIMQSAWITLHMHTT